jgi:hypothetical protein
MKPAPPKTSARMTRAYRNHVSLLIATVLDNTSLAATNRRSITARHLTAKDRVNDRAGHRAWHHTGAGHHGGVMYRGGDCFPFESSRNSIGKRVSLSASAHSTDPVLPGGCVDVWRRRFDNFPSWSSDTDPLWHVAGDPYFVGGYIARISGMAAVGSCGFRHPLYRAHSCYAQDLDKNSGTREAGTFVVLGRSHQRVPKCLADTK